MAAPVTATPSPALTVSRSGSRFLVPISAVHKPRFIIGGAEVEQLTGAVEPGRAEPAGAEKHERNYHNDHNDGPQQPAHPGPHRAPFQGSIGERDHHEEQQQIQ